MTESEPTDAKWTRAAPRRANGQSLLRHAAGNRTFCPMLARGGPQPPPRQPDPAWMPAMRLAPGEHLTPSER